MDGLRELALFAGAGGGVLGGKLLGWRTVCAVEQEPYAASILMQRQNDGILDPFPVWDDVCTFDGKPWRGCVDVVSGGFPCQDISAMGKGAGLDGERSGLWGEMQRIISEVRPAYVFVENSPALTIRGGVRVIADLAYLGYVGKWGVIGAGDIGASHQRDRMWIVASDTSKNGLQGGELQRRKTKGKPTKRMAPCPIFPRHEDDLSPPFVLGAGNGMADRVDRTKAIGNGQVPAVAALAWRTLTCN